MSKSYLYYATESIGKDVKNNALEKLGTVNDMTLSPDGAIKHLIVGFGGLLGMGESLVAVPYHLCGWNEAEQCVIVNVTEEQLKNAPKIDKEEIPSASDTAYFDTVNNYYKNTA